MSQFIEDLASVDHWFWENYDNIVAYVEQNFKEESWDYEAGYVDDAGNYNPGFFYHHKRYARAVIEDDMKTNDEKVMELLDNIYYGKSKIILVVGARGSGKTATALWLGEEAHEKAGHKLIWYVGQPENPEIYPKYFRFVKQLEDLKNNSFAVIDEAAIKYSARNFGKTENKDLTDKMVIARHKNISLVLLTQNISLVDINVDRLADIIVYKMASNYGTRKKKGEIMSREQKERYIIVKRMKPKSKEECLVEYLTGANPIFRRFINPLPTFWDENKISKSFKNFKKFEKEESKEIEIAPQSPY